MSEHNDMIEDIEARAELLSDWETKFVDSMSQWLGTGSTLTDRQGEKLTSIWNRVTAEQPSA